MSAYSDNAAFLTGSGDDRITLHGRFADQIDTGPGNDIVNPGLGLVVDGRYYGQSADYVHGGVSGSDLLVLDYSIGDTGSGITMSTDSSTQWPYADGRLRAPFIALSHPSGGPLLDWIVTLRL